MRLDLQLQLESLSNQSWLGIYSLNDSSIANHQEKSNQYLKQITKIKLQEILVEQQQNSQPINIIIAESDALEFLSAFLAGVIYEVNMFLCDPAWQKQEWQQVISLVKPDLIFAQSEIKDLLSTIKTNQTRVPDSVVLSSNLSQESLIMIPTGGSSGKIKFAMHTWSTLSASVLGFKSYFDCQQINSFCTLPLYHVSGLMQFMRSFLTQGKLIICSYQKIKQEQIIFNPQDYFISLVPTQLQLLLELAPGWLARFKTVLLGGASISLSLLNEARNKNIALAPTYGMTETASQIVTLKPQDFLIGNNSNGKVLPHAEIIIKSSANQCGLIKLKCNSLCLGYYPQLFAQSDLFITDDLGYFDELGYLHLIGRNSRKIITGGKNVFPAEIEAAILQTELVADICIIGISDRKWGQAVTAIYVPFKKQQNLAYLKEQLSLNLARYKQPKNWIELDSLPRNNRGKLNYKKVQEIAADWLRKHTK